MTVVSRVGCSLEVSVAWPILHLSGFVMYYVVNLFFFFFFFFFFFSVVLSSFYTFLL